jgi:ADP-ribose pyrophosphatase
VTFTVAIGMGLSERVLGRDLQRQGDPIHVGRAEAERLMGEGRDFGRGPLPSFLGQLDLACQGGAQLGLLLLGDDLDGDPLASLPASIGSLAHLVGNAAFVSAPRGRIPWAPVLEAIRSISGSDPLDSSADPLRFLLLGCHTEQQVLGMALFLRSIPGNGKVAVSPHLVGSATTEGHLAALRHILPLAGVDVLLDLREAADFAAIDGSPLERFGCGACTLEPADMLSGLSPGSRRILELLCMHWTNASLNSLSGGFSGSLLMLASGRKGNADTEPMVIKIDRYPQMRREIDGYHLVKDFLGKHVPTFDYPVARDDLLGVGMELAAMEGQPTSLQDCFEATESEAELERYLRRLDKALDLIGRRLHRNTRRTEWVSPYRSFHLHTDMQRQWLGENARAIETHWKNDTGSSLSTDVEMLDSLLRLIAANEDGIESDICLVHGDLNLKNIICDDADNVWFIDWTHSGWLPLEIDFAKLENDVKFVASRQFDLGDLPRVRQLEDYFLSQPLPAAPDELPEALRFARWDLRFRKVLASVRRIRQTCFAIKQTESWLVYRAALLKYSLHTLSFDKRRNRGDCDLPQLTHALYATDVLLNDLVVDEFQLRIRGERPPSYPPRQRVSIDLAPWCTDCADYAPPYHVEPIVLANDCTRAANGWADPEDVTLARLDERAPDVAKDESGRPLHPFGRTGIAGRGALGSWGPNRAVVAVVTRERSDNSGIDVLLGARDNSDTLRPPQGWIRRGEDAECAVRRVLQAETGWCPAGTTRFLSEGYGYDVRRTDHAWVVMHARHLQVTEKESPTSFDPRAMFDSVSWYPLDGATINRVPAGLARRVRESVKALADDGAIASSEAATVLAASG